MPAAAQTVAVDVGHFLDEPGAASARGVPEFRFNLELAEEIAAALTARGLAAQLVGADGSMRSLPARTAAAAKADFFLSVHHDSVKTRLLETWTHEGVERAYSDRFAGFSLFVSRLNPRVARSRACASAIGTSLREAGFTPSLYHADPVLGESRPFADRENGVHYFDNLAVARTARQPAVLLEAGVIVNRGEEVRMASADTRRRMAEAVAGALERCLGRPPTPAAAAGPK